VIFAAVVALGLGGPVQNTWGAPFLCGALPFLCGARKNFPAPFHAKML